MPTLNVKMANESKAEIIMYAMFGDMYRDGVTALQFRNLLKEVGPVREMTVHLHSEGGDPFEAAVMYGELKRHPARVIMQIDGVAASSGSYFAMAGDEIRIADTGHMMIHEPQSRIEGRASELEGRASMLRSLIGTVTETYAKRSGLSEDKVAQMMDRETWMKASEAVSYGFADSIVEGPRLKMAADFSRFKNVPASLLYTDGQLVSEYRKRLAAFQSKER